MQSHIKVQNQNFDLIANKGKPNLKKKKKAKGEKFYNAVLEQFGSFGDGLASLLNDGVGVVLDGSCDIFAVSDLHRLVNSRSQPRHGLVL